MATKLESENGRARDESEETRRVRWEQNRRARTEADTDEEGGDGG